MREDLMREAWAELEEQQRRNEETERARREEIRQGYPEIQRLIRRREDLIQSALQEILRGEKTGGELPETMEAVSGEIRQALRGAGFPEDYLTPVYACPECRDTGYVGERIRRQCGCLRRRYQKLLRKAIGLPEDGRETFESFDPGVFPEERAEGSRYSQREAMQLIRESCERWTEEFPEQSPRDLILSGKSGLGKTFLLHAMANRLLERGVQVLLISAYSFLETARRSYFENDGGLEELVGSQVLMLDDLGSEPMLQNVTIEQLFNLINERQRRNLATVISTNLNQDELKKRYTERIASRITDRRNCLYLPLRGRDIRNGRE